MRKIDLFLAMGRAGVGHVLIQRIEQQGCQGGTLVVADRHESPRLERAMIGHPRRNRQHSLKLRVRWRGTSEFTRFAGAARFQESEG